MPSFKLVYIVSFLIFLNSCGSDISVETFTEPKKNIDTTLKTANTLEQSSLEVIGACNFKAQNDPAYQDPLEFKVHFSDKINTSTFSSANIKNIGTGAITSITWSITNCGDKNNFLLQATGIVGDGSIIPVIDVKGIKYIDGTTSKEFGSTDNSVTFAKPGAFTWMGYADNDWSNNANWHGGAKPGVGDTAIFNNACGPHSCTVNIDQVVSVDGINLGLDFSGSITQAAGQSVNVGESGFNQSGGFYLVGANTFSTEGDFKISSGTFNSSGSLVRFSGSSTAFIYDIDAPTTNLNNVEFTFGTSNGNTKTVNVVNSLNILGNLTMNTSANAGGDKVNGGELSIEGDIVILNWDSDESSISMKISGANNQTITGASGESFASIIIDKSGGTATFSGPVIEIKKDFTYIDGLVDFGTTKTNFNHTTNAVISPGIVDFYDVEFTFGQAGVAVAKTIVGTLNILNDLTLNTHIGVDEDRLDGGAIDVKGNIIITHSDIGNSSTNITLSGATDQTISQVDGDLPGNITINKSSGNTLLGTSFISTKSGQDFRLQSGNLNMSGFNLTINDNLLLETLPSQTYLYTNCGTLNIGGATTDIGSGIIPSGSNPTISIADTSITEGGSLVFTVTLSESVCGGNFTANYTTNDDFATLGNLDYTDNDNIITITPGNLTGTITVASIADITMEGDETLKVVLTTPSHGSFIDDTGVGTILNDDDNGYRWTGDGVDDNWTTADNWSGNIVPPSNGSVAVGFSNSDCTNCNINIDTNIDVNGFWMYSDYAGTISQMSGRTIKIGSGSWIQSSGIFIGGDASITSSLNHIIYGGSFTATSDTMIIKKDFKVLSVASFIHNSGRIEFNNTSNLASTLNAENVIFNDFQVSLTGGCCSGNLNISNPIVVNGDFTFIKGTQSSINGSEIEINGNLIFDTASTGSDGGTTLLKLTGTGTQNITSIQARGRIPNIEFAATGIINFTGEYTVHDKFIHTSGTINMGTSKIIFDGFNSTISAPTISFYDLEITNNVGCCGSTVLAIGDVNITNHLLMNTGGNTAVNGDDYLVQGDFTSGSNSCSAGSSKIKIVGSTPQLITGNGNCSLGDFEINSTSTVTLAGSLTFKRDFTFTAGTVVAAGSTVKFSSQTTGQTIDAGAMNFDNVIVSPGTGCCSNNFNTTGALNVLGTLDLIKDDAGVINTGEIFAHSDVNINMNAPGSMNLTFAGGNNQTITSINTEYPGGLIKVNKTAGSVIQGSNMVFDKVGQDLHLVGGFWNMAGFDLNIADDLTLETAPGQTYLNSNCGSLTVGGTTTDIGSGITTSGSNPNITIADASIIEGGNIDFVVTLSEAVCGGNFTVNHTVDDGTATIINSDYTDSDGILTITPGNITGTISVATTVDANFEFDEKLSITLDTPSLGALIVSRATGTILNDDAGGVIWTGDAGDNDFENTANWTSGVVPGIGDIVVLDSTCNDVPSNCDIGTSSNISVLGFYINSTYPGTITQNSTHTITVGSGGWIQNGGIFIGGDSDIIMGTSGYFELSAGVFTATSAITSVNSNLPPRIASFSGGTFNHNNGIFRINKGDAPGCTTMYDFNLTGSLQFYDVEVIGNGSCGSGTTYLNFPIDKDVTVENNLLINGGNLEGDWHLKGNLTVVEADQSANVGYLGNLFFDGTTDQEYNFSSNLANSVLRVKMIVNKTTGDVKPSVGTNDLQISALSVLDGNFIAPTGNILFESRTTVSGGSLTVFKVATGASFQNNNGKITFGGKGLGCGGTSHFIDINSTTTFYDADVKGEAGCGSGKMKFEVVAPQKLIIENNLSLETGAIGGDWEVKGDIQVFDNFLTGSFSDAKLFITGTTDQTFTQVGTEIFSGNIEVNKASGKLIQATNINLGNTGQDLIITKGDWDMAGFDLNITDTLTLDPGTTLSTNCGTKTEGTLVNNGTIISTTSSPNITISDESEIEGINQVFTVSLSEAVCGGATTIDYLTTTGSAIEGTDFSATSGTLSIPAKTIQGIITVPTTIDADYEPVETFSVNLSNTSAGSITDNLGLGSISNDDASNFIWTGLVGDSNWSSDGNWLGGVAPGILDNAIFDSSCTNCSAKIDVSISVKGIIIESGFTGVLTQELGNSITIGAGGFYQAGGTFNGGDTLIDLNLGNFKLVGGSFKSTSAVFDIQNPWSGNRTVIDISSTANFIHNNGHVKVGGNIGGGNKNAYINLGKDIEFYNLDFSGDYGSFNLSRFYYWNIQGGFSPIVLNDFSLLGSNNSDGYISFLNGTVEVRGNVYYDQGSYGVAKGGTILLNGTGNQEVFEVTADGRLPNIVIDKVSGTVGAGAGTTTIQLQTFSLLAGVFNAPSEMNIINRQQDISDELLFNTEVGTVFNGLSTLLKFDTYDNASTATSLINLSSPVTVKNLYFSTLYNSTIRSSIFTFQNSNGFIVNNDFTVFSDIGTSGRIKIYGASIEVKGNLLLGQGSNGGTTEILLTGIQDQVVDFTNLTANFSGNYSVNKISGKIIQATNINLASAGQNLTITNGDWDMAGFDLNVADTLILDAGTALFTNCGTKTEGTLVNNGTIISTSSNPNITISDESEIEGTNQVFSVSLSEAVCGGATTIDYTTSDDSALNASDYTTTAGTLSIPAKTINGTITVPISTDADYEFNETFNLTLSNNSTGVITDAIGIGTIENDDLSTFIWTGLAGDDKWSTIGNWSGGVVPGATDVVVFNGTCTNCNSNIDVNADIRGLVLEGTYTGTITQLTTITLDIGNFGYIQYAGSFVGGDSNITFADDIGSIFTLSGGSFTSTSATLGLRSHTNLATGLYNHNNGTLTFGSGIYLNSTVNIDFSPNDNILNHYTHTRHWSREIDLLGSFEVLGDVSIANTNTQGGILKCSSVGPAVKIHGNLNFGQYSSGGYSGATCLFKLIGTGNQTVTNSSIHNNIPSFEIDKPSGTVFLTGDMYVQGSFKQTNGVVDTTGLTSMRWGNGTGLGGDVFDTGNLVWPNFTIARPWAKSSALNGNLNIAGNLTITNNADIIAFTGGHIYLTGDLIANIFGGSTDTFSTDITFNGTADQTFSHNSESDYYGGTIFIDKVSGTVRQTNDMDVGVDRLKNLHLKNGSYDMQGFNLGVRSTLTLDVGTTLYTNCGTKTETTLVNNGAIVGSTSNPNITISDESELEGTNHVFTVSLSEANCGAATTIDYNSSNGTAILADSDYSETSGTLSIPIGLTIGSITLPTTSDAYAEDNETVNMTLSNHSVGVISDAIGVGTILNDDGALAVSIFRSTGFGNTSALSDGTQSLGTDLTISGSIATFEYSLADDIGVGDAIQFDNSGDTIIDTIIFISGRISSTQYNVQTTSGGIVADLVSADTDWSIFRAYTSLANAENGIENTGINGAVQNFDTWSGGKDLITASQTWNIATYPDAIDTSIVSIDGWDTDKDKYLKIFTPVKITEVGKSQRHIGIWNTGGYILDPGVTTSTSLSINENYVHIDGLQIKGSDTTGAGKAINLVSGSGSLLKVSNNIIRGPEQASGTTSGVFIDSSSAVREFWFYNNIVYGFDGTAGYGLQVNGATPGLVYNNSFSNNVNTITVQTASTEVSFKNNLVRNSITSSFAGSAGFNTNSNYNLSDDGNMPGANSITSSLVVFKSKSTDESRLDSSDTIAKSAGIDISSESIFLDDQMGHPRGTDGSWDIGAHEAATKVYRSIGNGNLTTLQSGSGINLGISSGVVTFNSSIANNIGIGDAIQYDRSGDGSIDSLMFIYSRTDSTTFSVRDKNGAIPSDLGADDDWDIFRAYSSLANASNLIENTGLDIAIRDFSDDVDLIANNKEMVYPVYADSPFAAIGSVFDTGWIKSATANINLYVPHTATEVGATQRHLGQWSTSYVHFTDSVTLMSPTSYMKLDGVQLFLNNNTASGFNYGIKSSEPYTLLNSIVRGPDSNTATTSVAGAYNGENNSVGVTQVFINNVFYNWKNNSVNSSGIKCLSSNIDVIVYNSTFVNNERAISSAHSGVLLKNSISQDLVLGFYGTYSSASSNNLSFDTNSPGAGSVTNSSLAFVNKAVDNFVLAVGDTDAQSSATDLSSDGYYSFDKDMLNQSRPTADWDMGSFQY